MACHALFGEARIVTRPAALIRRFAAEPGLLVIVFALNGISYVPSLTLPWLISGLTSELRLGAAGGGIAGTILLGTIAAVSAVTALLLRPRLARGIGAAGGLLSLSVLILLHLMPAWRTLPALLLIGAGCGMACAGANALIAVSRDPVRLSGGMWCLSLLWQILIWWVSPVAARRSGLDGILMVQAAAIAVLLVIAVVGRGAGRESASDTARASRPSSLPWGLAAMLCLCSLAFWARDAMAWSMVDHRVAMLGVGTETLQFTLTGASLIGFCASLAAASLGLRFGRVIMAVLTQLAALIVLALMAGAGTAGLYTGSLLFWSGATLFAWPFVMELAVRIDPGGRVAALCGGLLFAGSAAGPGVAGILADSWPAGLLWVTCALGGIAAVAATVVAYRSDAATEE